MPRLQIAFREILDGLSNTIAMGEIPTDLGDSDKRTQAVQGNATNLGLGRVNGPTFCQQFVDPLRPQFWGYTHATPAVNIGSGTEQRGMIWSYGRVFFSGCNTILPPNRETCLGDATAAAMHFEAITPPGSRHQGGCHVLMADGAVRFITDSIEAGNSSSNSSNFQGALYLPCGVQSPFGLWGSLGSRASKETIDKEF